VTLFSGHLSGTKTVQDVALSTPAAALQCLAAWGVQASGVADDSRQVRKGDLFLAYPGVLADGRDYIADALARGAVAVLWEQDDEGAAESTFSWNSDWRVPNLPGTHLRALSGLLAHSICGSPSERLSLVAITGTNGKTTVSQWIAQSYPRRCAIIGTLGAGLPGQLLDTGFTTPEATTLMRTLAEFADVEVQACALEASSIGLEEGRLNGARVDVAVFTNLTRDHLDYHGTMKAYAAAKQKLFAWPRLRLAVINLDDPFGVELAAFSTASKVLGYTQSDAPMDRLGVIRAEEITETPFGLRFTLSAPSGRARVESGLIGRYNVSNMLAVAAVLIDAGMTPKEVATRFADLDSPPGRLEKIGGDNGPLVVVDYAHTPDALENILCALRPVARARNGRLTLIFGCGGDRDQGKRAPMGEVAMRLADRVVLTTDNPRREDPRAIIRDIRVGAPSAEIIMDRSAAIRGSIAAAHPVDVLLIAGKGHETYQEMGGIRTPFSDLDEVRAALAALPNRGEGAQ
jgi:UDP-N-acetylmuramoyl-L-alanyl-D-glutamate--2,6-diaminopimelate ligase